MSRPPSGNRLCRWPSFNYVSDPGAPASNPIAANRSPGFWGVIRGPGDVTDLGDAFSVRCRVTQNCGTTSNVASRTTGYWYVIKMPASGATTTTIRLFDAAYNDSINASSGAGPAADQGGTFTSGNGFTTTYQLYKQNNPLDFTDRTVVGSCPSLSVQAQTSYAMTWTDLCTITPSNGETYLLNVTSTSSGGNSAGANGYALEAVAIGDPIGPQQPAVHAYADMAMRTQKDGNSNASFYLAEVGPEHAGKTLVVQLFDAGDFTGPATVRPLMPKTGTAPTLNWTSVSSSDCSYTSSPAPNNQAGTRSEQPNHHESGDLHPDHARAAGLRDRHAIGDRERHPSVQRQLADDQGRRADGLHLHAGRQPGAGGRARAGGASGTTTRRRGRDHHLAGAGRGQPRPPDPVAGSLRFPARSGVATRRYVVFRPIPQLSVGIAYLSAVARR